jgi:hypothetical protein
MNPSLSAKPHFSPTDSVLRTVEPPRAQRGVSGGPRREQSLTPPGTASFLTKCPPQRRTRPADPGASPKRPFLTTALPATAP